MSSFVSGLVSGGASTATKRLNAKNSSGGNSGNGGQSVLSKLKSKLGGGGGSPKEPKMTGMTRQYDSETGTASPPSYKRGGKVKRGGLAKVHKGEKIVGRKRSRRKMSGGRR